MPVYTVGPPMAPNVLKLASNEHAWGPSPRAVRAFVEAASELHRYPDSRYLDLRTLLAHQVGAVLEMVAVGAGSEQLITNLMAAYAGPGDEVLVGQYGFALLRIAARMGNAEVVLAPEPELRCDVSRLLACVTSRTKVVAVATPNNPTGTALSAEEVYRLREGLPDGVLLILDLAYAEFGPPGAAEAAHALANTRDDTVALRTFSKAHGLAAARVGWAHAAPSVLAPIRRLRTPFPVSQAGVAAAMASLGDPEWLAGGLVSVAGQRESLRRALRSLGLDVPVSHTNFLYVDFGDPARASRALRGCEGAGVLLRPLGMYGLNQGLRVTVGTGPQMRRLIEVLTKMEL